MVCAVTNPRPTAPPAGAQPLPAPVRRRRRWPWAVGIIVVVLLALLVVADRVAAAVAESAVEKRLSEQSPFTPVSKPHVSIHGFPFLTQALDGRYDDIEVSGRSLTVDRVNDVTLDAHMRGVHVPLGKAMSRNVTSLPIDHVDASVVIPFREIARLTGIPGLTVTSNNGAFHVSMTVNLPGLSAGATASADAVLHLRANRLSYAVGQISVDGVAAPSALTSVLAEQMNGTVQLPTLPYRLMITGVAPTQDGVRVSARADHIVVETS